MTLTTTTPQNRRSLLHVLVSLGFLLLVGCGGSSEAELSLEKVIASPAQVSLHWQDSNGEPYRQLENLRIDLEAQGKEVLMLMNAGIYEPGETPTGLHVENSQQLISLNTRQGEGNFYAQPNGVFFLSSDGSAQILTTETFAATQPDVELATQSGPLLVQQGTITETAAQSKKSTFTRNGVGVLADGQVIFLYSREKITLHEFANQFVELGAQDALYLDGFVSQLAKPEPGKPLAKHTDFAAMIAVTTQS